MLRPAFLPALSGGARNLVPTAERSFGVVSSLFYLVVAAAFFRDIAPTAIMFGAACLVAAYLTLSMLLATAYSSAK